MSEINVFEDDSGVRRESGWFRCVRDCEILPDGYGVAWVRWNTAEAICCPVPWNWLMGTFRRIYIALRRGADTAEAEAYQAGFEAGRESVRIQFESARRQHDDDIRMAEARGRLNS